jgi:pyruvate/2-oxoglutarate dehydrogenase complex dihydrolipoamide dehydrogenase (E3) component
LNNYADGDDVLELSPDVVIVASGGLPNFGDLEGEQNCLSTWDVLGGDVEPARRVLVYDGTGRHEALSCAEFLAARGAAVTLATIDDQVGAELGYGERPVHRKQLYQLNVPVHLDLMLKSVRREGDSLVATLTNDLTDAPVEIEADQVVVERGTYPLQVRPQPFEVNGDGGYRLYRVGDAVSSRSLHAALLDAFRIAVAL